MKHRPVKLRLVEIMHVYSGRKVTKALDGITLNVHQDEFLAVVGPSGSGKTTLLQIIAGLIQPTGGHVYCDEREVTGPGPDRAYLFQEDSVFPWMTVRDNIEFGLLARRTPLDARRKISSHYVRLTGLEGYEDSLPKELSAGMLKRVDLARAYAIDPTVMLMDEPFGPLDAQTRAEMEDGLCEIWEKARKTVVFVTHDIDEAIFLGDRIVVFSERPGRVKGEIAVDLPRPRARQLRLSAEFLGLKKQVWSMLGLI